MESIKLFVILVLALTAAGESQSGRALKPATVEEFPYVTALLRTTDFTNYQHKCGGSILNTRAVLTAGQCVYEDTPNRWRFRVGSNTHGSGGKVHYVTYIAHNDFDEWSMGWDIAIVQTSTPIVFSTNVQPGRFAGTSYNLADNQSVTTVGWGRISMPSWYPGQFEDLRKHQHSTLDIEICRDHLIPYGLNVKETQICSGFIDPSLVDSVNANEKCVGEPGTPLVHYGVVVGIRSFAVGCSAAEVPTVSTRVSSYINWITDNA